MSTFNLIVAGGRDFSDYELLSQTLWGLAEDPLFADKSVSLVSGMARGADALGVRFAKEHNVHLISMPADWNLYGKSAGYRRNEDMAKISHGLVAFWDGKSRGTKHMIDTMIAQGKPVKIVQY